VFVEFEEGGGVLELAALGLGAVGLDLAELIEALLELTGKALALDAEVGDEAMGVDDIECDFPIERDGSGGAREHFGFEQRDAVEAPGSVGDFRDELRFGGSGGLVFVEEAAAMVGVGGRVFGGEDGGSGGQAVAQGVEGRTLLAGGGARTGGEHRVRTVCANARVRGWGLGVWGWRGDRVCHGGLLHGCGMGGWRFGVRGGGCCWKGAGLRGRGRVTGGGESAGWMVEMSAPQGAGVVYRC
jgi:hypothetical protein